MWKPEDLEQHAREIDQYRETMRDPGAQQVVVRHGVSDLINELSSCLWCGSRSHASKEHTKQHAKKPQETINIPLLARSDEDARVAVGITINLVGCDTKLGRALRDFYATKWPKDSTAFNSRENTR